jgi:hypothetical protein
MRRVLRRFRTRREAFTAFALATGLGTGTVAVGLLALTAVGIEGGQHRVHDLGAAALMGMLSAGLLSRRTAGLQQALVCFLVLLAALAWSEVIDLRLGFVVVPAALLALHPSRRDLLRVGRFSPTLAALAVLAAVLFLPFAADQASLQRLDVSGATHWEQSHWAGMAAFATAIPLVGLLAAARSEGWRIAVWSAGVASSAFGIGSLLLPTQASSLESASAALAVAGGVAFVALAESQARRQRAAARSFGKEAEWPAKAM